MVDLASPAEVVLTDAQTSALIAVQTAWPDSATILIGAAALSQHIPMTHRTTLDIDLAVAVSMEGFGKELEDLPGWSRHPKMEHRFFSPARQMVDVLPASEALIRQGHIEWPSGSRMSLVGFDLAFAHSAVRPVQNMESLTVAVPSAPTIAFLKMRAWLDRPQDRAKDLQDLARLFSEYVGDDDDRRWTDDVVALGETLQFEQVSPFLLGRDLAQIAKGEHRPHVEEFLEKVEPAQLALRPSTSADRAHGAFQQGFGQ